MISSQVLSWMAHLASLADHLGSQGVISESWRSHTRVTDGVYIGHMRVIHDPHAGTSVSGAYRGHIIWGTWWWRGNFNRMILRWFRDDIGMIWDGYQRLWDCLGYSGIFFEFVWDSVSAILDRCLNHFRMVFGCLRYDFGANLVGIRHFLAMNLRYRNLLSYRIAKLSEWRVLKI